MVHSGTAEPEICQFAAEMSGVEMQAGVIVVDPDWKNVDPTTDFEGAKTAAVAE